VRTVFDVDEPTFLRAIPDPTRSVAPTAFVTIMKGCDERCSFCIVPHTRGPERYRPSSEIVDEIARLVAAGVREITLLGQTVNSYRDPERSLPPAPQADPNDPDESEFAALLRRIANAVPGLSRLRYTSPHPRHVTPSLILAHREVEVLAQHVHLPVQSGSNRMLKRMIRRYDRDEYIQRAEKLKAARQGLTLSTDIIVGFSGETDQDFQETLDLVRNVGFTGLFGFKYSRRPYTPALKLEDDVSEPTKGDRLTALFALSEELLQRHLTSLVGSFQVVLVEGASKSGSGRVTGRTERNEIVHLTDDPAASMIGELVEVRVMRAFKHSLEGEPTDSFRARRPSPPAQKPRPRALPVLAE
jgi:tRNA-2-methylthio-N6-dimethylallyladenosine synthase